MLHKVVHLKDLHIFALCQNLQYVRGNSSGKVYNNLGPLNVFRLINSLCTELHGPTLL